MRLVDAHANASRALGKIGSANFGMLVEASRAAIGAFGSLAVTESLARTISSVKEYSASCLTAVGESDRVLLAENSCRSEIDQTP